MSWLTQMIPWLARRGPRRRPRLPTRRGTCRLTLELLETRDVPSVLVVTNNSDSGAPGDGSLRGEIAAAQSGDTIRFDGSLHGQTITLTQGRPLELSKDLAILGLGADQITISGGNATEVFKIDSGATDTLDQLTIANGFAVGIRNDGTLAVDHSTLTGNSNGITNGATLTVDHSTVSGNSGLGIFNAGILTVEFSTLSDNQGGGISNDDGGTLTVDHSTLSGNSAFEGGGIRNGNGTVTVEYSTLSGNRADNLGGAIFNNTVTMTVDHCTLSDNSAGFGGGGIFNEGGLTVEYTTFSGNSAFQGGGILNLVVAMTVDNSTLSGNSAFQGGGIFNNFGSTVNADYSIICDNTQTFPGPGADVFNLGILNQDHSEICDLGP